MNAAAMTSAEIVKQNTVLIDLARCEMEMAAGLETIGSNLALISALPISGLPDGLLHGQLG